jgi:hypothetical protein
LEDIMPEPNLIFDSPERDLSVDAVLGAVGGRRGRPLRRLAERLHELEPELRAWLAEGPDRLDAFVRNPAQVLSEAFPGLGIPDRLVHQIEGLPPDLTVNVVAKQPPAPPTILLASVWQWAAASQQNTKAFAADPTAAIQSVGAQTGASQAAINEVVAAMDRVRGIFHLAVDPAFTSINHAVWKGQLP